MFPVKLRKNPSIYTRSGTKTVKYYEKKLSTNYRFNNAFSYLSGSRSIMYIVDIIL